MTISHQGVDYALGTELDIQPPAVIGLAEGRSKRAFDKDYRLAVLLYATRVDKTIPDVAGELNISPDVLRRWVRTHFDEVQDMIDRLEGATPPDPPDPEEGAGEGGDAEPHREMIPTELAALREAVVRVIDERALTAAVRVVIDIAVERELKYRESQNGRTD